MKKFLVYILLLAVSLTANAGDLTKEQMAFRLEIFRSLGQEGFNPDIDSDGDIKFKYDGITYYVSIDSRWSDPYMVSLFSEHSYTDTYSRKVLENCISLAGQSKGVKLYLKLSAFRYLYEIFCKDVSAFTKAVKPVLREIETARSEVNSIVKVGIGDLNMVTEKDKILEKGIVFYEKEDYEHSFTVFKLLAGVGYSPAYKHMGESYELGAGVKKNIEKMVYYYEKAISSGDYRSAYKLAEYYYERGDYPKAFDMYMKCASNENENKSNALYRIGYMQQKGQGTAVNLSQAIQSYKKSVQYSTELECKARLALIDLKEPVEKKTDFTDATKTMLMGISSPREMYIIGEEYEQGLNKRFVSLPKAYAYYKAAADRDYVKAYCKMGEIYISKFYPFNDQAKSEKYYQKAFKVYSQKANLDGDACYELGRMYQNGWGISKDLEQAKFYFKSGALKGDKNAAYQYGLNCKNDLEFVEAVGCFQQAAEAGHGLAMYELAICYEKGIGTNMSREKAIEWYTKCASMNTAAKDKAQEALKRMGASEDKY